MGALADASEYDLAADAIPWRVASEALGDLRGEFPGWGENECAQGARFLRGFDAQQLVENGQGESRRFAGPGLGAGEDVPGVHRRGDRGALDRGGLGEAQGGEVVKEFGVEVELVEAPPGAAGGSGLFLFQNLSWVSAPQREGRPAIGGRLVFLENEGVPAGRLRGERVARYEARRSLTESSRFRPHPIPPGCRTPLWRRSPRSPRWANHRRRPSA